jgi:hypothetical protein
MDGSSKAAWLERTASRVARQAFSDALENVDALVPKMGLTLLRKSKFPPPQAIKFASIGRKPTPGMMARGGLPMQLLTGELVSTYIPAQYGGLMVMDKATVSPGLHAETTLSFISLPMMPIPQEYIARGLEHPLTGRRHPTILISSKILPDNKYWFGQNRPEQVQLPRENRHSFRHHHSHCLI